MTCLAGANCRHTMTPYVPGLSKLPRTDFSEEEKLFGKTSDEYYEATQVQRRLERQVRKYKRRIALGQERGLDMTGDRARLGQAQKRVRQWCKQNKLPRQLEREKAYGVAKQPRALGRLQRDITYRESGYERRKRLEENEKRKLIDPEHATDDKRRPENHGLEYQRDCAVNFSKINSKNYLKALRGDDDKRKQGIRLGSMAGMVYEDIKRVLKATDKTPYEQLYYYDLTDKKRITSVVGQKTKFGVKVSGAKQKKVKKAVEQGHIVVSLHNHPKGSPPSAADIRSGIANGQKSGLTCGHDGSLYQYTVVHKPIAGYDLSDKSWEDALLEIATNPDAATKSVLMKWGVLVDRLF